MAENGYRIAVVDRTLDLIDMLAGAHGPVGVSELAREIGATKSAVFRILVNLERRGYVIRDPLTNKYLLGGRLIQIGHSALKSLDVRTQARPVLEELHAAFNETVNLGMLIDSHISYVDMIESDHGLRMSAQIGAIDDLHSTALGKAVLSFMPKVEREQILSQPLERKTKRTLTDPELLRAELARIRESGVAEDHGENEEGARCFGAPIFNYQGNVMGAVSVSSPESRFDEERLVLVVDAVRAAAKAITVSIGGSWRLDRQEDGYVKGPQEHVAQDKQVR